MLDTADAWHRASLVLAIRLTDAERAAAAWALLRTFDADRASLAFEAVFPQAGPPIPLLGEIADEAQFWASQAGRFEICKYAAACAMAMSERDRRAFEAWLARGAAT